MSGTRRALSLRTRLTIVVTALFAVVVAVGSWFLLSRAETAWIKDLKAQDVIELNQLAASLPALDPSDPALAESPISLPQGRDGTAFRLRNESGTVIGTTPTIFLGDTMALSLETAQQAGEPQPVDTAGDEALGSEFSTESIVIRRPGGDMTLTALSWLGSVQTGVATLRNTLLLVTPLLIVAVAVLAWLTTGRAFKPVAAIADQVDRITDDRLDERVPVPATGDEIAHLARTMNRMLDRLSGSRRRQREFVSDISHELRNPIATSQAKLEIGLSRPEDTDWRETAEIVLGEQERLATLVEDLLLLARLDESQVTTREDVDLDDIILEETRRVQHRPVDLSSVQPVRITGDPRQLARLVRNLIDNAGRHARDRIMVSLRSDVHDAVLTVDDDGPGIPPGDRQRVFERFVRLDPDRSRGQGGTGLGLAIVQAVVASHGGSISVDDAPIGGARIIVRLPVEAIQTR